MKKSTEKNKATTVIIITKCLISLLIGLLTLFKPKTKNIQELQMKNGLHNTMNLPTVKVASLPIMVLSPV